MHVFLTGGGGMLGSAIMRLSQERGYSLDIKAPSRKELELTDSAAVRTFVQQNQFDLVIHAAAKVGGISANVAEPARFLSENLALNLAVIGESANAGIPKLLNIGSSCIYPRNYRQPLVEEDILQAPLEPTNEGYALAKIVAAKHCEYLSRDSSMQCRTIIPCNLYGPADRYAPEHSHLIAGIVAKLHKAKINNEHTVTIWGEGSARREALYVDDLAAWILLNLVRIEDFPQYLNVGAREDRTVLEYYRAAAEVIGYQGRFNHDLSKPAGMHQKLIDSSKAERSFGWSPSTPLREGLRKTYACYVATI